MSKIICRDCKSLDCNGCNIYNLAQMLNTGKFGLIMDENYSIQTENDVMPVVHAHWTTDDKCSACGEDPLTEYSTSLMNFCPYCGAIMDEED